MIGGPGSKRSKRAWAQMYRALEHRQAKDRCRNGDVMKHFPKAIQDFANVFVQMQIKREDADYNPGYRAFKSAVITDILIADAAMKDFDKAPPKDRRAFAAFVILKRVL